MRTSRRPTCCSSSWARRAGRPGGGVERIVRKLLTRTGGPPPALVLATTRQWCTGGTYGGSVHGLKKKDGAVDEVGGHRGHVCVLLQSVRRPVPLAARRHLPRGARVAAQLHRARRGRRLLAPRAVELWVPLFCGYDHPLLAQIVGAVPLGASRRRAVRADAAAAAAARCQPRERRADFVALFRSTRPRHRNPSPPRRKKRSANPDLWPQWSRSACTSMPSVRFPLPGGAQSIADRSRGC